MTMLGDLGWTIFWALTICFILWAIIFRSQSKSPIIDVFGAFLKAAFWGFITYATLYALIVTCCARFGLGILVLWLIAIAISVVVFIVRFSLNIWRIRKEYKDNKKEMVIP